ncbi:MAG: vanadium-dependent haloperoxidase [Gemmatimonadales bacterium]
MRSSTRTTTTHLVQAIVLMAGVFACGSDAVRQPLAPGASEASQSVGQRNAEVQTMAAWNVIALKTTLAGPFSPPRESRNLAIVSGAVNDAVCSIMRKCAVYVGPVAASHDASIQAAVDAAAHRTLAALYPPAAPSLDASYDSALATLPAGSARDAGAAAGEAAAAAILAMRANDHSLDVVTYTPTPGLGSWVPTPPAFAPGLEPGWGRVTPFLMASGSQLRPPPPPVPGSDAAVRDYLEIVAVGAANSTTRTPEQSEVALFWISTGPQLWNQVAQEVTTGPGMNAAKAAHAYMLLNMAGADAIIAAWEAKYTYAQWRPLTAIRSTLDDGSAETVPDPTWSSFIPTPRFPDYPAGHATYAGAAETVLSALFGENPGTLSITSPTAGNVTHTYPSFHAIADEVSNARVWGGIHWRTSVVVGRAVGNRIGDVAMSSAAARGRE